MQVERTPDAVAVLQGEESLTYVQLDGLANRLAIKLASAGVSRGQLVGVAMERSLEMMVSLLAILKAGAAYVPIDPDYPAERVAYMIEDSQVAVLLTKEGLVSCLETGSAKIIHVDTDQLTLESTSPDFQTPVDLQPSDPAYVIYTSGTTGRPKGVVVPHRAICNQLFWLQDTYHLTSADRFLQKAPFSFDISVFEIFWPLIGGGQVILARPGGQSDPAYLVSLIQRHGITLLDFLPSMLEAFLQEPGVENCRSMRQVLVGGELITQELVDRFSAIFSIPIDNVYGPTETTIQVTRWVCQPHANLIRIPIGRAVANTNIHVLNPSLRRTPPEIAGEIYIGGRQLALGYWNQPELTAEKFIRDPFSSNPDDRLYRTGDLGYFDADGVLYFLGRTDDQVKLRGHRIELRGIAAIVQSHWAVREALAVVREDRADDQKLVAYYLLKKDAAAPSQAELRGHAASKSPAHSVPSAFVLVNEWPLLPNGKIDRAALPAPVFESTGPGRDAQPMTPMELQLAALWSEILGVPEVGAEDDFFDLGGDSLLGLQLVTRIRQEVGNKASIAALFESSTVRAMARCLGEGEGTDDASGAYLILHHELAELWLRYLPVTRIDVQEGFFDLGGTRDSARAMLMEVERLFHTPQGLEPFERQPTIEWLVGSILRGKQGQSHRHITPLVETGDGAPFFYLHGDMTGVGFYCRKLSRLLGAGRPFHALAPIDYRERPWEASIVNMAERHVEDILNVRKDGPFVIGGFCSAAIVAFEVAHLLRDRGHEVERVILLEAEWAHPLMRLWRRWNNRSSLAPEERIPAFSKGWGTMEKWRAFREMERAGQLAWIRRKLLLQEPPPMPVLSEADAAWLNEYGEGPVIAAWAECDYRPRRIDVPVDLILSDDTLCRRQSMLAAWDGLAPEIRHYFLPGSHHGMITSGAERLAGVLREILSVCR
ncbi:MAG: amino acid adenylation domain-containing protein [Chthoniobacterales bacterium]